MGKAVRDAVDKGTEVLVEMQKQKLKYGGKNRIQTAE